MANTVDQMYPRDADSILNLVSLQFADAILGAAPTQLESLLATTITVDPEKSVTTFPYRLVKSKMREVQGDFKYRKWAEGEITLKVKHWQDGFELTKWQIRKGYFQTSTDPSKELTDAAQALVPDLLLELLEANPIAELDGQAMFSASHPSHPTISGVGTYDNLSTDAFSLTAYKAMKDRMRAVKGANGRSLKVKPTALLLASNIYEDARAVFHSLTVNSGDDNLYKNEVELIEVEDLPAGRWYGLDTRSNLKPFGAAKGLPELSICGTSDELYKRHRRVSWSADMVSGVGALFPQAIQRCGPA